jgi:hypothetical protein
MNQRNLLALASVLALAPWTSAASASASDELEVIYGEDDRRDLFDSDVSPRMFEAAQATAALLRKEQLRLTDGSCHLPAETFGDSLNLCEDEPFREQPNPAFCSGFLVGEDVFVTAGHCITSESDCASTAMAFGFGYSARDQDVTSLPEADIYFCKEIIARELNDLTKADYAVVRLDRPVQGRTPLQFRKTGTVSGTGEVTVIGHPAGLPTKVSAGAHVRSNANPVFFVANLDTYGGNSGSAVVDSATGMVEGILVRGENDFVTSGDCRKSNRCLNDACRGEEVTRSTVFAPHVP